MKGQTGQVAKQIHQGLGRAIGRSFGWVRTFARTKQEPATMIGDPTLRPELSVKERRRYPRLDIGLAGRYMLNNRHEFQCWTINVSPGGIAVLGLEKGAIGERVIADFHHIGRVEGLIVRNFDLCFALSLRLRAARTEKIEQVLDWLSNQQTRRLSEG
jgi:hypothetical protein